MAHCQTHTEKDCLPYDLDRYRWRVAVEAPYELRRPEPTRLAAYVQWRGNGSMT